MKVPSKERDFLQVLMKRMRTDGKEYKQELQNRPKWMDFKERILQKNHLPQVQFMKISRKDQLESQRSLGKFGFRNS